jgi:hypothetical protein
VRLKEEHPEIAHAAHKGQMIRGLGTRKACERSLSASSVVKGKGLEAGRCITVLYHVATENWC